MTQLVCRRSSPALWCGVNGMNDEQMQWIEKMSFSHYSHFPFLWKKIKKINKVEKHSFGLYFNIHHHFFHIPFFLPGYGSSLILKEIRCDCARVFVNKVVNYWVITTAVGLLSLIIGSWHWNYLQRCKIALYAVRFWCIHHDCGFSLWIRVFYCNIKRIWAEHLSHFTERRQSAVNNPETT